MYLLAVLVKLPLCMVLIAASGFLANPGPPNVKYVSQLEHLPCSPDLLFWVISRCGFFIHQVSHSQDSRTSSVDFKLQHYHCQHEKAGLAAFPFNMFADLTLIQGRYGRSK